MPYVSPQSIQERSDQVVFQLDHNESIGDVKLSVRLKEPVPFSERHSSLPFDVILLDDL